MKTRVAEDLRFDSTTGRFRREDGALFDLVHDTERDLWRRNDGAEYVRNLSKIADPIWIRIDQRLWRSRYNGRLHRLDWKQPSLPRSLLEDIRTVAIHRLRRLSPAEISKISGLLSSLKTIPALQELSADAGLGALSAHDLVGAMMLLPTDRASVFRSICRDMATLGIEGCTSEIDELLSSVKIARGRETLASVRSWDPNQGALTTAELEALRTALLAPQNAHAETDSDHFARVTLRTLVALGRRAVQILGVEATGVRKSPKDPRLPAVIWVPGAKGQRNDRPRPYDLPDDLFHDLQRFSQRPAIREAQEHYGFFFVTPKKSQSRVAGPRDAGNTTKLLQDWIERKEITSPRTGKPLHVTPTRLRHTAATQLMRKGWDLADIKEFLEHRSDHAVLAYLDAVGSDLAPALERADRALGGLFTELTGHFLGTVVPRPKGKIEKPVLVPSLSNRAVIGQCGFAASCPKSPFSACLSGCEHFLFFKDADVEAARRHIAEEHERWRAAEPSAQRARAHDDFARMERGLLEAQEIAESMND